jgi:hypothetical protein
MILGYHPKLSLALPNNPAIRIACHSERSEESLPEKGWVFCGGFFVAMLLRMTGTNRPHAIQNAKFKENR